MKTIKKWLIPVCLLIIIFTQLLTYYTKNEITFERIYETEGRSSMFTGFNYSNINVKATIYLPFRYK